MTPSNLFWTPGDLLVHQDCDRELANRIVRRSSSWRDPASEMAETLGHGFADVLTLHAAAVRSEVVTGFGVDPHTVVDLPTGDADSTSFGHAARRTASALDTGALVVSGAAFESAHFRGTADLMIASDSGWVLADCRLSAITPAQAAVMLAALGAELESAGLPVAGHVLLLGVGGVKRRWSRTRLGAVIESRVEQVRSIAASVAYRGDQTGSAQRACAACDESVNVVSPMGGGEGDSPLQPAMRFPAARPDDLFLHVEHVQPALGSDRPHVVLTAACDSGIDVWWGEDQPQQVAHALELLGKLRERLARDKKLHVFHRGGAAIRHLLRMTAGEPEAAHLLSTMLGDRGGRVLIDLDDAVDSLGVDTTPPAANIAELLSAAVFTAWRLGNRDAIHALRQGVTSNAESRCREMKAVRDQILEVVEGAAGAGVALSPYAGSFADELARSLRARAGLAEGGRSPEEEVCAVVASALGYFERERSVFGRREQRWMSHPTNVWSDDPDVLTFIEPPVVTREPGVLKGHRNLTRGLEAIAIDHGSSRVGTGRMRVLGRRSGQPGVTRHVNVEIGDCTIRNLDRVGDGRIRVLFDQHVSGGRSPHPIALVPPPPPDDSSLHWAVHDLARLLDAEEALPRSAVIDVLARRPPRLVSGLPMPRSHRIGADLVAALQDLDDSYVAVQGPPGTGKTRLGASAVRRLVYDGWKVGVVAQSHAAVEHFLDATIKQGLDPDLVAKGARKGAPGPGSWRAIKDVPSYVRANSDGCLVGGTVWTFSNSELVARSLDLLVVEEAGQLSLAHTMAAARASRNLLLLGDPQQLPGVSEGVHDEPIDVSPLEWLAQGSPVLPESLGYFLAESFRMGPGLCRQVSELSYSGRLESSASAAQRRLKGVESGVLRVEVEHAGNTAVSVEEADEVVRRVKALLGAKWLDPAKYDYAVGLGEDDFLVVAPFNAQVNLIRDTLARAGLSRVRVGTVDRFQGQEAPIVLLSMASSRLELTPRSAEFLLDPRRLNVAISRAQWMAVVICSRDLARMIPMHVNDLELVTAFAGTANWYEHVPGLELGCDQRGVR